tara:strand:- start:2236 stop:4461 length:2226 start_codon:yes stop_codon:yes gene_type:complete
LASNGNLLSARIAEDGQWRFPELTVLPKKFEIALCTFEDRYFRFHPGVNPVSLVSAIYKNIVNDKIVSGGSTITMQLMRMSRGQKTRTYYQKIIEIIWAFRIELSLTKDEVLSLYCSHAPFGGNVVGIEAASWRYFNRAPDNLSWAEAACLAVLPNAPSLIHLGRNRELLLAKRNRLLNKLFKQELINAETLNLALLEPIPKNTHRLPQKAQHLMLRCNQDNLDEQIIESSIRYSLQNTTQNLLNNYQKIMAANEVYNAAVLVIDNRTKQVITYIGNTKSEKNQHENYVDIISSSRSTGSILKPFLYASCLDDGLINPRSFIRDTPIQIAGFTPQNYHRKFNGLENADIALSKSLNIPFVNLLRDYGVSKFKSKLTQTDFSSISKPADHYGLSLILGGAEENLWNITKAYSSIAYQLNSSFEHPYSYPKNNFSSLFYLKSDSLIYESSSSAPYSHSALWFTSLALKNVARPYTEQGRELLGLNENISWKTGTSYGFRDAWAVGYTPDYTVGIWVGNADGEGRPGLTGLSAASPLLFSVFNLLRTENNFELPVEQTLEVEVCKVSGYKSGKHCTLTDKELIPRSSENTKRCSYHIKQMITDDELFSLSEYCLKNKKWKFKNYLSLSPVEDWFYKKVNPFYDKAPPFHQDCNVQSFKQMQFIYPNESSKIKIPKEIDGSIGRCIFELAHKVPSTKIYWHLDDVFIGTSENTHTMECFAKPGTYKLTAIDELGNEISKYISIVE